MIVGSCPACGYVGLVLLDLYSGAGGAGEGYARAGFHVCGIDSRPQPRYPHCFIQGDALEAAAQAQRGAWKVSAVHASPPCQDHSALATLAGRHGTGHLLADTRAALAGIGVPTVIENVPGAPMNGLMRLCGTSFGLGAGEYELRRHRLFEITGFFMLSPPCQHRRRALGVYGNGGGQDRGGQYGTKARAAEAREAMGITWMRRAELSQAIPPAYTEYIGRGIREAAQWR